MIYFAKAHSMKNKFCDIPEIDQNWSHKIDIITKISEVMCTFVV